MTPLAAALVAFFSLPTLYTDAQSTLATVLANRGDLDPFNELLDASGFSSGILRNVGSELTVFAPSDDAFQSFPAPLFAALLDSEWSDHTTCFVSYHTVDGIFLARDLSDGMELDTLNDEDTLTVSGANPILINDATIIEADVLASNGVAHVLDAVLMPPCVTQNIYQQLTANQNYSILSDLLQKAGLTEVVSTTAPITLFAPPDQAWQDMGERFIERLSDPENLIFLKAFLMNHVISGNWYSSRLDSDSSFTLQTTQGTTAFFFTENSVNYITNSEIAATDTLASNGVIHSVNPVIILAAVADLLLNAQVVSDTISFSNFTSALQQANFFDALFLDDLNAPRTTTVFAPDDAAFSQVPNETLAKLLDPNWSFHLRELLRYHLADGTIQSMQLSQLETVPTSANGNVPLTITSGTNLLMVDNATVIYPDLTAYNGVIHGIDAVLFPASLTTTILAQIQANTQFSTFLGLLEASPNLTSTLEGDGPMTLFIPTNAAFELFDSTVDSSSITPNDITRILQYHVSLENVFLNELPNQTMIPTLFNGQNMTVSIQTMDTMNSGEEETFRFIDEAQVLDGGLASNGVLYVLDQVLLPELPTEMPTSSPAPTFDGFVAPSNAPSAMTPPPVSETTPFMPPPMENMTTSSATQVSYYTRAALVLAMGVTVGLCGLL